MGGGAQSLSAAVNSNSNSPSSGAACDIWSLGCFLYELITSQFLFCKEDWTRLFVTRRGDTAVGADGAGAAEDTGGGSESRTTAGEISTSLTTEFSTSSAMGGLSAATKVASENHLELQNSSNYIRLSRSPTGAASSASYAEGEPSRDDNDSGGLLPGIPQQQQQQQRRQQQQSKLKHCSSVQSAVSSSPSLTAAAAEKAKKEKGGIILDTEKMQILADMVGPSTVQPLASLLRSILVVDPGTRPNMTKLLHLIQTARVRILNSIEEKKGGILNS